MTVEAPEPLSSAPTPELLDVTTHQSVETFEDVFRREHAAMVRLAYLLVRSQPLAEEAVQDAFARLLDRFHVVTNPGGFVRTATVNRCRDLLRRRGRERRLLDRLRPPAAITDPEVGAGELDDVLAGLAPRRREVVVLRYYLGHSGPEIAELLDMNEVTVRTTLHRAMNDLRHILGEER